MADDDDDDELEAWPGCGEPLVLALMEIIKGMVAADCKVIHHLNTSTNTYTIAIVPRATGVNLIVGPDDLLVKTFHYYICVGGKCIPFHNVCRNSLPFTALSDPDFNWLRGTLRDAGLLDEEVAGP